MNMPEAYWCKRMESMRKLIKNGVIYDGSGRKPYTAYLIHYMAAWIHHIQDCMARLPGSFEIM